jgi:hypothetical protein
MDAVIDVGMDGWLAGSSAAAMASDVNVTRWFGYRAACVFVLWLQIEDLFFGTTATTTKNPSPPPQLRVIVLSSSLLFFLPSPSFSFLFFLSS